PVPSVAERCSGSAADAHPRSTHGTRLPLDRVVLFLSQGPAPTGQMTRKRPPNGNRTRTHPLVRLGRRTIAGGSRPAQEAPGPQTGVVPVRHVLSRARRTPARTSSPGGR